MGSPYKPREMLSFKIIFKLVLAKSFSQSLSDLMLNISLLLVIELDMILSLLCVCCDIILLFFCSRKITSLLLDRNKSIFKKLLKHISNL